MSETDFTKLVKRAISELSPEHIAALEHVSIVVADKPTPEQAESIRLRGDHLLLGLYQGVPRTQRSGYESGILPDIITIFRLPILQVASTPEQIYAQVKQTVWHEIAHYFGINHEEMDRRQQASIDKQPLT